MKKWIKNTLIWVCVTIWFLFYIFCYYVFFTEYFEKIEVYEDISHYEECMSFGDNNKWHKWSMNENIRPRKITENMNVLDYKMVRYDPRDVQYLGYLVVEYSDQNYTKEVERLKNYDSTEYMWYYWVGGISWYDLLAINADKYYWFVYALTDWKSKIIYVELIFCNYFMDLKYEEYIPREYLLDGFDASIDNSYKTEMMKKYR